MSELTIVRPKQTTAQKILGFFGKGIVNIALIAVAFVWLVPTVGLFLTSLRTSGIPPPPAGGRCSPNRQN